MLPIVAGIISNLINNGMHKVADQVLEKGVEAVEQKRAHGPQIPIFWDPITHDPRV